MCAVPASANSYVGGDRALLMRADGHLLAFRHIDDLDDFARTGGDEARVAQNRDTPLQDDHHIVHSEGLVDALAGIVSAEAYGDWAAVALVDHITREYVARLPGALEGRIGFQTFELS